MSDIFISYASEDRARAKVLAGALEDQGWSVWWDREILPGRQFSQVIKEAIDEAKCIIVLWSKESVNSDWVQNEAAEGARRKILVPALIDDVEIPFEFRRIQAARLVDWEGRSPHPEFDRFLKAVCAILGQPLLPKASERTPDEQQPGLGTENAVSKSQKNKVLAAICIVALIAIVSIGVFLKYLRPKTYSLTATAVGGSVTKDPNKVSYNHGETVTLEAVPNPGYSFTNWSGDLSGSTNPATITIDSDKSVTASFTLKTYSLTATAVDGSVTKSPDQASYNHGETVTLEAGPNKGYSFKNWSGDLSGSTNPDTLVMDADKSVTASFALKTYSLTATAVDGSVTKSPDQASYNHGETVILEAVANTGYSFENWSGDLSGSSNPATLVMNADKSVTASFALKVVTNSIGMKLVYIPDGSFMMGTSGSAALLAKECGTKEVFFVDEFPQHQVRISEGFWMGQTEVTQGQYKSVMNAQPWSGKDFVQESDNNPAVYVSPDDAIAFCRKLSQQEGKMYRLPTEAEWEYACRAGTTTRFSFGDNDSSLGDYAWCRRNTYEVGQKYAHPIGQKKPNPWGLYDMHGNVWEWCSDWYDENYYSYSPSVDPKGPPSGTSHSVRSGSWNADEHNVRCAERSRNRPDYRHYKEGFRVVRSQ